MHLDTNFTISHFQLLAKAQEAHLEGEVIIGKFSKGPLVVSKPALMCEEFANLSRTKSEILRFTQKYGPLTNKANPGQKFRFELFDWRCYHEAFCMNWRAMTKILRSFSPDELDGNTWSFQQGFRLSRLRMGTAIQLESALDLINLCFFSLPWNSLRVCQVDECETPFFIADHLNQKYCNSEACTRSIARKVKREYWNRNKERLLAKRRRDRSRSK